MNFNTLGRWQSCALWFLQKSFWIYKYEIVDSQNVIDRHDVYIFAIKNVNFGNQKRSILSYGSC